MKLVQQVKGWFQVITDLTSTNMKKPRYIHIPDNICSLSIWSMSVGVGEMQRT